MHFGLVWIAACLLALSQQINPYHVLGLPASASQNSVAREFKKLKKKHKRNEYLLQAIKEAHHQIMTEKSIEQTERGRAPEWEMQKLQTINSNKLIAQAVAFLLATALKILPFLLCFCLFRRGKRTKQGGFANEMDAARWKHQRRKAKLKRAFQAQ